MNARERAKRSIPSALLGAGKQSDFVLQLLQWMGLEVAGIVLFDDAFPAKRLGALGNIVRGSLKYGFTWVIENRLPAMVTLGSRNAALRYALFEALRAGGVTTPSLAHPSSIISPESSLGPNALVMPGCVISTGVTIGALATLFAGVTIEHDCNVADNVTFGPGTTLSGYASIGAHSFIGAGATIAPEVRIGERVMIGAGAVVVDDIPPGMLAFGVPARVYRSVASGDDAPTEVALRQAAAGPIVAD